MAFPADWNINYHLDQNGHLQVADPRAICPYCRHASTFTISAVVILPRSLRGVSRYWFHLILKCNSAACGGTTYVTTSVEADLEMNRQRDFFFMHPSRTINPPHPAIPNHIGDAWLEAQKSMEAVAPMAAAVMCRRVLYGALLDKNCKEHPLREGLEELIAKHRLPAIFDEWLPAIKDDGHDAAHPHRALEIDPENVSETMEYTAELLRHLYIEPYEFQQRKARNLPKP